jgi:hypothetical protein
VPSAGTLTDPQGATVTGGTVTVKSQGTDAVRTALTDKDGQYTGRSRRSQLQCGFGRDAGANVDVITKSGTNAIHGSVWEFFRDDILNANDTFLKIGGQKRAVRKQN